MLIRIIPVFFLTCFTGTFCLLTLGGQVETYELRVENKPDVPVRIISASVKSWSAGTFAIDLVVENLGKLPVEKFVLALPDGECGFGYPLKAGETREID